MYNLFREIIYRYASDKVSPKLHKKIMKKLAPNTYRDKDSGNDILFTTAYSRQHDKAVEDYNKEVESFNKGKEKSENRRRKSTEQLQSEAEAREDKRVDRQKELDEIKATKDQFRLDMYDDPQRFIQNLLGGSREKAIHVQYAHEVAKDLADSYDAVAKRNPDMPSLEEILGLDSSKFTATDREKKENEEQAKENKRKLKDGEITKLDFTRLEQRRKAKQQLRKKERKKEIIRALDGLKGMSFPNISDEEAMGELGLSKKKLNLMSAKERNKAKAQIARKKKEIAGERYPELTQGDVTENIERVLKGETEQDQEILKNNPVLRLMSSFRQTVSRQEAEDEKTNLNERQQKQLRTNFLESLVGSVAGLGAFGSGQSMTGSDVDSKAMISKMISKIDIDKLSQEDMDQVAEGFKAASTKLQAILENNDDEDKGLLEKLSELQEEINDIFDDAINNKEGAELGASIAAGAMEMAYTRNPLFGVNTEPSSVFKTTRDSMGREIEEINELLLDETSRFSARRYNRMGESETRGALDDVESKMRSLEKKGDEGSAEYLSLQSVKDGIEVSLLVQEVKPLPNNLSPAMKYLVELAKQTDLDAAYDAIKSLKGGASDQKKSDVQTQVLSSLSDDQLSQALGGDSGPFADALEIIQGEVCPNIPINGDMAGEPIGPGDVCPYPVGAEVKATLKKHVIQMMVDHHVLTPTAPLGSSSFSSSSRKQESKGEKEEAKKHKKMKQIFEVSPEKFQKILTQGTEKEKEESLAYLIYQMRIERIKDMDFGSYSSKKNKGKDQDSREKAKRDAILEMIKKNKEEDIREMLSNLDEAMKADLSTDDTFLKLGKTKRGSDIFNSLFIRGCYLDSEGEIKYMQKKATVYDTDYQERASRFEVGMRAYPFFKGDPKTGGVIVAVFPAIGMVDLQFPHGVSRYPAEDLVLDTSGDYNSMIDEKSQSRSYPVSAGKRPSKEKVASLYLSLKRRR